MADSLPIKDLVAIVGDDAAALLMAAYGGTCLAIPKSFYNSLHPIALVIGLDALKALSRAYGGETLEIPRGIRQAMIKRNNDIAAKKKEGLSNRELARMFGLSTRQIGTILRTHRHQKEQGHG